MNPHHEQEEHSVDIPAGGQSSASERRSRRFIPLGCARLCLECEAIHQLDTCPRCGNREWMRLLVVFGCDLLKRRFVRDE